MISLFQNPFASMWIERKSEDIKKELNSVVAAEFDQSRVNTEIESELELTPYDWDYIDYLLQIAEEEKFEVHPEVMAKIDESRAASESLTSSMFACLECAYDSGKCLDTQMIVSCNLPLQLTPIGDIQTLTQNYIKSQNGEPIDELETNLAVIGLIATGAIAVSGGASTPVSAPAKAVASMLRVTLKTGKLTKPMRTTIFNNVNLLFDDIRWKNILPAIRGESGVAKQIVNPTALARLTDISSNINRIYVGSGKSIKGMLEMLPYIDNVQEARLLANVVESVGPRTRFALKSIGKSRVLRIAQRWSDEFIEFIMLLVATVTQLAGIVILSSSKAVFRRFTRDI